MAAEFRNIQPEATIAVLNHPGQVSGLVLASGYYYPTARADVALVSPPAVPILGDLLCYTVVPLLGQAIAPRMFSDMFSPQPVPAQFSNTFPIGLMLRPGQIMGSSKNANHMIPDAFGMAYRYAGLSCPVAIITGDADKVVPPESQAQELHKAILGSQLDILPAQGICLTTQTRLASSAYLFLTS